MGDASLNDLLKRYFGFDTFRPLQEEIIRTALEGRDAFVLMPTGGGKSLCYQLPALANDGLTIVVSPLIALMKDQVDALQSAGAPATFLNSTLDEKESRQRLAGLHRGEYRLLYVAPERLMLSGTLDMLESWKPQCIAIDEAHCISEWGHDFRPEYRRLAELRDRFGKIPMMALTATATERVQADIVSELRLDNPERFVASFNRPNLIYRVLQRQQPLQQVLAIINKYKGESGIVYCASRKGTEQLASRLAENGVKAAAYHAGMDARKRARNQEAFIHDDGQVICATIAFGMGIDKPDVRFVIHRDLPKNIEGYYQETGRAGRGGSLQGRCQGEGGAATQGQCHNNATEERAGVQASARSAAKGHRGDAGGPQGLPHRRTCQRAGTGGGPCCRGVSTALGGDHCAGCPWQSRLQSG